MRGRARILIPLALAILAATVPSGLPAAPSGRDPSKDPNAPPTAAERIAGRWRVTLDGLSVDHQDIFASLALDGEILIGTLTVGRETVHISSGRVAGSDLSFAFRHLGGDLFKMKGSAVERGLEGTWEALGERGTWRAARIR